MQSVLATALILFVANLMSLALVALSAYMIHLNRPYWGWVLVAAVLCCSVPDGKKQKGTTSRPNSK